MLYDSKPDSRQKQGKKTILRGSYTIEAALLVPMIGLLIICMLLTAFLYYDKAQLESRARQYLEADERVLPTGDDLFFLSDVRYEAGAHEVSYEAELRFPGGYRIILSDTIQEIAPVSMKRLRILREIEEIGGELRGTIKDELFS